MVTVDFKLSQNVSKKIVKEGGESKQGISTDSQGKT